MSRYILRLSCPDRRGIVAAVGSFLLEHHCNIVESAQFGDQAQRFFMRVCFDSEQGHSVAALQAAFTPIAEKFSMQWNCYDVARKQRVVLMVSRFGHCLNDLLYRYRIGALPIEIPAIVSNHRDFYRLAAAHDIPFHYLPVNPENKPRQEQQLLEIVGEAQVDLVVLARYMQILSPALCQALEGRAINIHHSFLPSFQGARPHQQAHDRGVKLIGATAHYVTQDLDEGPIIEQDVARVDHAMSVEDCAAAGRDVECAVLARAVKWHVEHRILLNGHRTVIFR
ncbi:formyltetrahydrofolate deformylase [Peristeroidobacter soli]|jgi:formyltetrahydrofolate deformylase|uniref:formyltetrahydrofolate deformylase n=1 Tax=Peristeroidobacter soli TaxID=2497877 RepID=UPI00101D2474|nr:formyltetrahydrofolate deformylase [Peristeroidobacter soli]